MSDEEGINAENQEHELWEEVERTSGVDRARALTALGRIYWDRSKYKESLGYVEAARDLLLEAGREQYIEELTDVNFGIMNNLDMLDRAKDAAEAAGEVIALYRETDHPMLGELLRDQGRYWFAAGEYEKSIAAHMEGANYPDPERSELQTGIDALNLGMSLKQLARYAEAIEQINEALTWFKKLKDPYWASRCHGELAEIYFKLEDPIEIEVWSRKALDFAELIGDSRWQYILNYYLGVAQKLTGDLDSAEDSLTKAKAQAILYNIDWNFVVKIEKELAGIEVIRGHVSAANEIFRRVSTIEETLLAS
jgi:tetratricopeptide (TPR) repeat protein